MPALTWFVVAAVGWREGTILLTAAVFVVFLPVLFLMRDDPARVGLKPYGAPEEGERGTTAEESPEPGTAANAPSEAPGGAVRRATRTPEFWLLSGSFFICGASSNGIIDVHFVPHSIDHGIPEVTAAGVLAVMGAMNFVGTIASGWLTDRYDLRKLLAVFAPTSSRTRSAPPSPPTSAVSPATLWATTPPHSSPRAPWRYSPPSWPPA